MAEESMQDIMNRFVAEHIELYLTDPEAAHIYDFSPLGNPHSFPTLLLSTTGRRSGEQRLVPLVYKKIGDEYVVVASKAGAPTNPAWFLNLESQPQCHLRVGKQQFDATARVASDSEYQALWDAMVELFPGYSQYAETTQGRKIPIVLCKPD